MSQKKSFISTAALVTIFLFLSVFVWGGCAREELDTIVEDEVIVVDEEEQQKEEAETVETDEPAEDAPKPDQETSPQTVKHTFAYAILEGIDWDNEILNITQLLADSSEPDIGPSIALADDYKVIRSVVIRKGEDIRDYEININLGQIPMSSEIGIDIEANEAKLIISQIFVDEESQVPRVEAEAGENFVYAILEWADYDNKLIGIEQLINEPYEQEVGDQLQLAEGYQVQMSVVERHEAGEEEYIVAISLKDIPIGEEIGIIVNEQGQARAVVYNINVE